MANKKIRATAELFLDTKNASKDARQFCEDIKGRLAEIETVADKMTVFKNVAGYLSQIDRNLAILRAKNEDAFIHMFDGLDDALRKQLEDVFNIAGKDLGNIDVLRGKISTITTKSKMEEVRAIAKEINAVFTSMNLEAPFNIENEFTGKVTKEHIESLSNTLNNFAKVWKGVVERVQGGFGFEGSGDFTAFSQEVQTEITKLEDKIKSVKNLMDSLKSSLKIAGQFQKSDPITGTFDTSEQHIKELIEQFDLLSAARQNFINEGDTSSSGYYINLAEYTKTATELLAIYEKIQATTGNAPKGLIDRINDDNGIAVFVDSINKKFISGISDGLSTVISEAQASLNKIKTDALSTSGKASGKAHEGIGGDIKTQINLYDELSNSLQQYYNLLDQRDNYKYGTSEYNSIDSEISRIKDAISSIKALTQNDLQSITDIFDSAESGDIDVNDALSKLVNILGIEVPSSAKKAEEALSGIISIVDSIIKKGFYGMEDFDIGINTEKLNNAKKDLQLLSEQGLISASEFSEAMQKIEQTLSSLDVARAENADNLEELNRGYYGSGHGQYLYSYYDDYIEQVQRADALQEQNNALNKKLQEKSKTGASSFESQLSGLITKNNEQEKRGDDKEFMSFVTRSGVLTSFSGQDMQVGTDAIVSNLVKSLNDSVVMSLHNHPDGMDEFTAADLKSFTQLFYDQGTKINGIISNGVIKTIDFTGISKDVALNIAKSFSENLRLVANGSKGLLDFDGNALLPTDLFNSLVESGSMDIDDLRAIILENHKKALAKAFVDNGAESTVREFSMDEMPELVAYLDKIAQSGTGAIAPVEKLKSILSSVYSGINLDSFNNIFEALENGSIDATEALEQVKNKIQQINSVQSQLDDFFLLTSEISNKSLYGSEDNVEVGKYVERLEVAKRALDALGDQGIITSDQLESVNNAFQQAKDHLDKSIVRYTGFGDGEYDYDYYDEFVEARDEANALRAAMSTDGQGESGESIISINNIEKAKEALSELILIIEKVQTAVQEKTNAFINEDLEVNGAVQHEISILSSLIEKLESVKLAVQFIKDGLGDINNTDIKSADINKKSDESTSSQDNKQQYALESTLQSVESVLQSILTAIGDDSTLSKLASPISGAVEELKNVASGIVQHQKSQKSDTSVATARIADKVQHDLMYSEASKVASGLGQEYVIDGMTALVDGVVKINGAFKNAKGEWEGFTVKVNEANQAVDLATHTNSAFAKSVAKLEKEMKDAEGQSTSDNDKRLSKEETLQRALQYLGVHKKDGATTTVQFKDNDRNYTISTEELIGGLKRTIFQTFEDDIDKSSGRKPIQRTTVTVSDEVNQRLLKRNKEISEKAGLVGDLQALKQYTEEYNKLLQLNEQYSTRADLNDDEINAWNKQITLVQQLGQELSGIIVKREKAQQVKGKAASDAILKQVLGEANSLKKKTGIDLSAGKSDQTQAPIIDAYNNVINKIKEIDAAQEAMTDQQIQDIHELIKALREQANAYIEANGLNKPKETKKSEKSKKRPYGSNTISTQRGRYQNIQKTIDADENLQKSSLLRAAVDKYKASLDSLEGLYTSLASKDPTLDDEAAFKAASEECAKLYKNVDNLIKAYNKMRSATDVVNQKTLDEGFDADNIEEVKKALSEYVSATYGADVASSSFTKDYRGLLFTIDNGDGTFRSAKVSIDNIGTSLIETGGDVLKATGLFETLFSELKGKFKSIGSYFAASLGWQEIWQQLRLGVQYVRDIDLALTELKKVTNATEQEYNSFLQTMSQTASTVGGTVQELTSSAADWARLGYSMKEAGELAKNTAILMNVSEFENVNDATDAMISALKAFDYSATDSLQLVDIFNAVGKNNCRNYIGIYN